MAARPRIPSDLRQAVRLRANHLCEYCHANEAWQYVEFTMEHLVPLASGGETNLGNLALACFACNRRKWHQQIGTDPETGIETRLFNPRLDSWNDHFSWSVDGLSILGHTAIARTTIAQLELNRERSQHIRAADVRASRHPPLGDRREAQ